MRPSILSLLLALTATHVVASPKGQKHTARSNATTTTTASTTTSSSAPGCNYVPVIGPNEPTIYTGCYCSNHDDVEPQYTYIFNLTSTYPACTRQITNIEYPMVPVESGDPGMALCEDWISAGPVDAPWKVEGVPEMVPPYVGLCCILGPGGVSAGCV